MLIVHLCFDLCPSSHTSGASRWQQAELQMLDCKDTDFAPGQTDNLYSLQCENRLSKPECTGLSVLYQNSIWAVLSSQTPPTLLMVGVDSIWVLSVFFCSFTEDEQRWCPRNHSPMVTIGQKLIVTFWQTCDFLQEGLLTWGHTLSSPKISSLCLKEAKGVRCREVCCASLCGL